MSFDRCVLLYMTITAIDKTWSISFTPKIDFVPFPGSYPHWSDFHMDHFNIFFVLFSIKGK